MPSANDIRSALLQIGVDIDNPDSVEQFNAAIDFAREAARRRSRWQDIRRQIALAAIVSALTGAIGAAFTWLTSRMPGLGH